MAPLTHKPEQKIGLLVGVIVAGLLLLGLFIFLLLRLCRRNKISSTAPSAKHEKKRGLKILALSSPSRAALTSRSRKGSKTSREDSDDGGLDFKDEDDSYNTSLADLHAASGRAPYVPASQQQQGQAITTDNEEREELDMSQHRRHSVFVAPEENFAGRGVPSAASSPSTPRMSFEAPAFAAYQAAQAAARRSQSTPEVEGYTPTTFASRQEEQQRGGYDWTRAPSPAGQGDWVQSHQGRK